MLFLPYMYLTTIISVRKCFIFLFLPNKRFKVKMTQWTRPGVEVGWKTAHDQLCVAGMLVCIPGSVDGVWAWDPSGLVTNSIILCCWLLLSRIESKSLLSINTQSEVFVGGFRRCCGTSEVTGRGPRPGSCWEESPSRLGLLLYQIKGNGKNWVRSQRPELHL